MGEARPYTFENVSMTWGIPISGWGEGDEVLSMEPPDETWQGKAGAGGAVEINHKPDVLRSFSITLLASAPDNDYLYNELAKQVNGVGKPLIIVDNNTGRRWFAPKAWITKEPNRAWGTSSGEVEWMFQTAHMKSEGEDGNPLSPDAPSGPGADGLLGGG